MKTKVLNSVINSSVSGLGSFVAIEMLAGQSANATMDLFGMDLTLSQASGLSQFAVQLTNELLYKDWAEKYVPDTLKPYFDVGDYLGQSIVQGLVPAGLLYLANGQVMTFSDFVKIGAVQFLGGAGGTMLGKRAIDPLVDRYF